MAYPSLTMIMLISAPGDVDPEDLRVVQRTINRWNFRSGRRMVPTPVTVLPVSWSEHAYSEFGVRPQGAINEQLVKEADLAFAMFANRLGTPTGEADSGTVEEMEVMRRAGKHVSVVRSTAPVSLHGVEATAEKGRLEGFLDQIKGTERWFTSTRAARIWPPRSSTCCLHRMRRSPTLPEAQAVR